MGKDSKHQRTKGSVQPSSSSRTAELLQKSGGGPLSFLAAAAEAQAEIGGAHCLPPTTVLTSLLIDEDLPPEIRMVFRKLQKKDSITKIKALSELSQLLEAPVSSKENSPTPSRDSSVERPTIDSGGIEELSKLILPHWSKSYQKLAVDDSRKVREQAQFTHTNICKNVGRNLAPFLKHLMPSWYLAQFDLYSPVSSAAKKAFQTVFPVENKRIEVIKFCKTEILKTIVEHLQLSFRGSALPDEQQGLRKEKKKQQQGKKKNQDSSTVSASGEQPPVDEGHVKSSTASSSESSGSDGEPYSLRVSFASLQSLNCLIEQNLVENDVLEEIFGENGLLWIGADISKEILIRRSTYDVLTTLTVFLGRTTELASSEGPAATETQFRIPSAKCTKFINSALSANQKETLPNLWNTFLMLTLNGVLSDIHLARKQLLTCCKNGFYGNASQIGPSVLPLLARIWEGFGGDNDDLMAKQEFSHDIIAASIQGYSVERSLMEKAAIARTLGEAVGFLCKHEVINMNPVYQFIFSNITDLTTDFARLFGALVKDQVFYDGLVQYGIENQSLNSKEFGAFVVGICSTQKPRTTSSKKPCGSKKSVKFQEGEEQASTSNNSVHEFNNLSEQKRLFLQSLLKTCVEHHLYKPVAVLSRSYKSEKLWTAINVSEIDLSYDDDKLTRLQISLDLIQVHPENPSILIKFSDEFENFQAPSELKVFLKEVNSFTSLQPVKRWIRMSVFTDVIELLLKEGNLTESELQAILKFVLCDLFPMEFTSKILSIISNRMHEDSTFFDNLSHILASSTFRMDISDVYKHYWELYFLKSVSSGESELDLELIETVCFRNLNKLDPADIAQILEKYLESCEKVKQIDVLIDITRRLGFPGEMVQPVPKLNVKPELLSFIGQSYAEIIHDNIDLVPKFSKVHRAGISRAIFKAKLAQDSESESDLINPLLDVIYAQSLSRIWAEVDKSGYFDKLNQELANELDVVSSRLTEKIYENSATWRSLWEEINKLSEGNTTADPIWQSKTALRVLLDYCAKAELTTGLKKNKLPNDDNSFESQVNQVLSEFSQNIFKVSEVIPWLTEKRIKKPEDFEFEPLFRHIKNKAFVHKLLVITLELIEHVEKDDEISEEFLSLGTCWIAAWLKNSKNLNTSSKTNLLWVSNLSRAVYIISKKARNLNELCPKFTQEYVEFHSSQIYPIIYSLYVQLNQDVSTHSFWTLQALFYVSTALSTTPSTTLAFIEPDSVKLCEIFGKIVGDGVSLPSRIAAYRILRKVRYDISGEGDLPIVPPVIGGVIKQLLDKLNSESTTVSLEEVLISYLLIWDALLKIQKGSNEFATYVRDQEHLLTPFLNTLFFSDHILLENATAKNFEKESDLSPGTGVNLLHLACTVVQRALRNLPYTVRWWWNNQVTRQRDRVFVEKFIVKYLSSKLAAEELGSVKLREGVDDNVTIHCHSGCNELIAHYRIEETNVTLTVSLPLNHPLGPVTVKISDKKLHGKISHLLNTRSHSLSAGLKLWKENLDGLYKDVDECAICFFILHNVTKQIPKLGCKTCKKKFHAACLYKWFSTSNKSECPLCRNLF